MPLVPLPMPSFTGKYYEQLCSFLSIDTSWLSRYDLPVLAFPTIESTEHSELRDRR